MGPTQQSVKHDGHLVVFESELCNLRCRFWEEEIDRNARGI